MLRTSCRVIDRRTARLAFWRSIHSYPSAAVLGICGTAGKGGLGRWAFRLKRRGKENVVLRTRRRRMWALFWNSDMNRASIWISATLETHRAIWHWNHEATRTEFALGASLMIVLPVRAIDGWIRRKEETDVSSSRTRWQSCRNGTDRSINQLVRLQMGYNSLHVAKIGARRILLDLPTSKVVCVVCDYRQRWPCSDPEEQTLFILWHGLWFVEPWKTKRVQWSIASRTNKSAHFSMRCGLIK